MNPFWKDLLTIIGPTAGVLIGWFLSEYGQRARLRRDDRRVLGKSIADLLEVYETAAQIRAIERGLQSLGTDSPNLLKMIEQCLSKIDNIKIRYDEAISALAGSDPISAFQLRAKVDNVNAVYDMRQAYQGDLADDQTNKRAFVVFDVLHQAFNIASLKKTIVNLSWKHGWMTWLRTKKIITETDVLEGKIPDAAKRIADATQKQLSNITESKSPNELT